VSTGPLVLVVGGPSNLRRVICELSAESLGGEAIDCSGMQMADETLARRRPDVVVLNVTQASGARLEWAKRLRDQQSPTPVLAISASARRREAMESGCAFYLSLPFTVEQFLGALHGCLSKLAPPRDRLDGKTAS
jgi:CheY-like chemotaxis protein